MRKMLPISAPPKTNSWWWKRKNAFDACVSAKNILSSKKASTSGTPTLLNVRKGQKLICGMFLSPPEICLIYQFQKKRESAANENIKLAAMTRTVLLRRIISICGQNVSNEHLCMNAFDERRLKSKRLIKWRRMSKKDLAR